jgi:hypothetical protein
MAVVSQVETVIFKATPSHASLRQTPTPPRFFWIGWWPLRMVALTQSVTASQGVCEKKKIVYFFDWTDRWLEGPGWQRPQEGGIRITKNAKIKPNQP